MRASWMVMGMLLVGCAPRYVDSSDEIDAYLAQGNYAYACVAYGSSDDGIRTYAAQRLASFPSSEEATACTCKAVYDAEKGTWDEAVAKGLEGSRRDDLAACLKPAATDPRINERKASGVGTKLADTKLEQAKLVEALGLILAPAAWDALAEIAKGGVEVEVRASAVRSLRPSSKHTEELVGWLNDDEEALVRAAAADALEDHKGTGAKAALLQAARGDADEQVRLAAVRVLGADHSKDNDAALCEVMLQDASAAVRAEAITSFKGTKSKRGVACLRERLKEQEPEASVRQATLDALAASPHKDASEALCTFIGPFVRMYIRDKVMSKVGGADIVEAQNNNHWEASYECVAKAMAQGGYSCYARNYLAHWFKELGGEATPPHCPGMSNF